MNLKNFDIRHMPIWTHGIINELEETCWKELQQDCILYNQIVEERDNLIQRYSFITTFDEGREITEPIQLNPQEAKTLSRYLILDVHKQDMEKFQMYLLGCRHMTEWFELIKVI